MDWRISFLMETGFSQTRWRPVIRGHAVPSDIIAPIRGLSEATGPATQSDALATGRAITFAGLSLLLTHSWPPAV